MDTTSREQWERLRSPEGNTRYEALNALLATTEQPVEWAYEVWDDLLADLAHPDNHRRAIAAQLLANLANSDPEGRMVGDFDQLLAVTRDECFVIARHSLQSLWKVGAVGPAHRKLVVERLAERFRAAAGEKNGTLCKLGRRSGSWPLLILLAKSLAAMPRLHQPSGT